MSQNLVKVGALWVNEGRHGKYMQGSFGDAKLLVFPNDRKTKDNQPDFIMWICDKGKPKSNSGSSDNPWLSAEDQAEAEMI